MKVSVIIPAYNEEKNIVPMCMKITAAMRGLDYEIIAVDDGSSDRTYAELGGIRDRRLKVIKLPSHRGKEFALYKGFKEASGEIIATIDADQQDDPRDIPLMVKQLGSDCDCVCGWRRERKDGFVKRVSSRMANFANNLFFGGSLHDNNCPVKVFRKRCVSRIKYFSGFHRFISAMVRLQGFKIKECEVRHYPRVHGVSKYGIRNRLFCTLKTFFLVRFNYKRLLE